MRNQPSNLMAVLSQMVTADRPCPCILLLGPDEIPVSQLKQVSPNTMIILRVWPGGGSSHTMSGEEYFRANVDGNPERKLVKYHQLDNEDVDFSPDALQMRMTRMAWVEAHGYREATPTPSTGGPDLAYWSHPYVWNFLRYVRDHGHIFACHEYDIGVGDWSLYRFLHRAYPQLPPDLRDDMPKMVFTEFGIQKMRDMPNNVWLSTVKGYQAELAKYPFVIGAALWSVGDTGNGALPGEDWTQDNWGNKIALLPQI